MAAADVRRSLQFRAVVFRQLPRTADFEQSRMELLPGTSCENAAWEKIFAALDRDRALVGGAVEEVQRADECLHAK